MKWEDLNQVQKWKEIKWNAMKRKPLECLVYPEDPEESFQSDPSIQVNALKRDWSKLIKEWRKMLEKEDVD